MSNYPIPFDETRRQRVLDETGVLDEDAWAELDELTQSAAKHWNVPISVVSLVDRDRQFFKSCVGLDASETGRDVAFCAYTIMGEHAFVTLDAREDKRFKDNPLVTGAPHIRFYAGAPIVVENVVFGSFCVIDSEPRAHFSTE
ncbi:MAG: GAF domain-containing protein, partial [Pseudomonadota bacterium]